MTDRTDTAAKATTLLELHRAPELLTVVNVWDVISARTVAAVEGTTALASASHSIAAAFGYATSNIHIYGLGPFIEPIAAEFGWTRAQVTAGQMLSSLLNAARSTVVLEQYVWQWMFPGAALVITVLAINFVGDGLRDAFDPRSDLQ